MSEITDAQLKEMKERQKELDKHAYISDDAVMTILRHHFPRLLEEVESLREKNERLRESVFGVDWHGACVNCGSQVAATGMLRDEHDEESCPTCQRGIGKGGLVDMDGHHALYHLSKAGIKHPEHLMYLMESCQQVVDEGCEVDDSSHDMLVDAYCSVIGKECWNA